MPPSTPLTRPFSAKPFLRPRLSELRREVRLLLLRELFKDDIRRALAEDSARSSVRSVSFVEPIPILLDMTRFVGFHFVLITISTPFCEVLKVPLDVIESLGMEVEACRQGI